MKIWHDKIDPKLIDEHPDNANEQTEAVFNALVANIRERGMLSTPLVRVTDYAGRGKKRKPSRYQCVDGHHRIEAYKAAGKTAPIFCIVADMTDAEAAKHLMSMNSLTGDANPKKLGSLVDRMIEEMGLSAQEIADHTAYPLADLDAFMAEAAAEADIYAGLEVGGDNKSPAEEAGDEEYEQWVFYVDQAQGQIVHRALERAKKMNPTASENPEADALEFMCAFFLSKRSKFPEDRVLFSVPPPLKVQFTSLFERYKAAHPGNDLEDFVADLMEGLEKTLPEIVLGGRTGKVSRGSALGVE